MKELKRYLSYIGIYKVPYWSTFIVTLTSSAILTLAWPYMNKLILNALEYGDRGLFVRAAALCVLLVVLIIHLLNLPVDLNRNKYRHQAETNGNKRQHRTIDNHCDDGYHTRDQSAKYPVKV